MADDIGRTGNQTRQQSVDEAHERAAERARERASRSNSHGEDFVAGIFVPDMRSVIGVSMIEATNRSSATVEAEHLLLALLFARTNHGAQILAGSGLSYETFGQALEAEREQTLARIGVSIHDPSRLQAAPRVRSGRPRFGASAKDAFDRASKIVKAKRGRAQRFTDVDFLVGILSAELGTVPRALARGGFDRQALLDALIASSPTQTSQTKS